MTVPVSFIGPNPHNIGRHFSTHSDHISQTPAGECFDALFQFGKNLSQTELIWPVGQDGA
jgi:hypothetical protein